MRHFCTVSTFNELIVEAEQAIRARIDSEADELTGYFVAQARCCSRAFGAGRRSQAGLRPKYRQRLSLGAKAPWRRLSEIWPKATIRML
jgi:hypothetical protein